MPRDGAGIYSQPYPEVIAGTTIESVVFNGNTNDVEQDLNTPRPIVAGGTAASDATQARANLHAEVAKQVVTNYDSHVWESGSFTSETGATAAPKVGYFYGTYTEQGNPAFATVEAWEVGGGSNWVRHKTSGVWGTWLDRSVSSFDARYVNVDGDTMTGDLTLPNLIATGYVATGNSGVAGTYYFGNSGGKTLAFDGTKYTLNGAPLSIVNGGLAVGGATTVAGTITSANSATQGVYYFGNAANNNYIWFDGINYMINNTVAGGAVMSNASFMVTKPSASWARYYSITTGAGARSWSFGTNAAGSYAITDETGGATRLTIDTNGWLTSGIHVAASGGNPSSSAGAVLRVGFTGSTSLYGMTFKPATDATYAMMFINASDAIAGSIYYTATLTSYGTSSDGRMKEDLKSFDAGNIIDQTAVYDFAWKSTGERSFGVVAQEAIEVYPLAVVHTEECEASPEVWNIDYSKYVPVLLQELKSLRARVTELEGGKQIGTKPP